MSGEVAMGFFNTPTVIAQIKDGKLKALGVTSLARAPLRPQLPTLDEQGVEGRGEHVIRLRRRCRTREDIVSRMHAAFTRVLGSAEAKDRLGPQGFDRAPATAPPAFLKLIADDLTKWCRS